MSYRQVYKDFGDALYDTSRHTIGMRDACVVTTAANRVEHGSFYDSIDVFAVMELLSCIYLLQSFLCMPNVPGWVTGDTYRLELWEPASAQQTSKITDRHRRPTILYSKVGNKLITSQNLSLVLVIPFITRTNRLFALLL